MLNIDPILLPPIHLTHNPDPSNETSRSFPHHSTCYTDNSHHTPRPIALLPAQPPPTFSNLTNKTLTIAQSECNRRSSEDFGAHPAPRLSKIQLKGMWVGMRWVRQMCRVHSALQDGPTTLSILTSIISHSALQERHTLCNSGLFAVRIGE